MKNSTALYRKGAMVAAIALSLALLFPSVSSTLAAYAAPQPDDEYSGYTPEAKQTQQYIHSVLDQHPDWVGMLSWNQTNVKIAYLGPADSNPYKVGPEGYLAPSKPVQQGAAPTKLSGASSASIFQERATTYSIASSSSNVDYRQILNAMSSNNARWLQVGLVYDTQNLFGTSPSWRVLYNSWFTSSATNEFAVVSPDMIIGANDPIEFTIKAHSATAGRYTMAFFDNLYLRAHSYSFTASGDTGHNINLGKISNFSGEYPSGPMVEEFSNSGTGRYNFGTQDFFLYFLKTSSSSETTAVAGWLSTGGSCASVTTYNSPAEALFSYTC